MSWDYFAVAVVVLAALFFIVKKCVAFAQSSAKPSVESCGSCGACGNAEKKMCALPSKVP